MRLRPIYLLAVVVLNQSIAQNPSPIEQVNVNVSGFLDTYYSYDFNRPDDKRQSFVFNHNRHNNVNINLALLRMQVAHKRYRANIGLHTGTYVTDNYAAEPLANKFIYEANAGFSLLKNNKLWLDAGVFESYIGFESALSSMNPTLTRSLAAESSPYFLTGAQVSWTEEKWELGIFLLNGWQRIQMVSGNTLPSTGSRFTYKVNSNFSLNWNTFVGTDDPDSTRRMRYFSNFYGSFEKGKWKAIAGFDLGFQQEQKHSDSYNNWFNASVILSYQMHQKWMIGGRWEYFKDPNELIISSPNTLGFNTQGYSLNLDYRPLENIVIRCEGRWFYSTKRTFEKDGDFSRNNAFITVSLAALLK